MIIFNAGVMLNLEWEIINFEARKRSKQNLPLFTVLAESCYIDGSKLIFKWIGVIFQFFLVHHVLHHSILVFHIEFKKDGDFLIKINLFDILRGNNLGSRTVIIV